MKNIQKKHFIFIAILIIFFFTIIFPETAVARPGGGSSYSGGSSSSGGGGGGGLGIIIYLLFELLPPYISIPLVIIIFIFYNIYKKKENNSSNQVISAPTYQNRALEITNLTQQIHKLKVIDQNFSRVLFLDFVSSLYVKFQAYKYTPKQLNTLNPFFDKSILSDFANKTAKIKINEIVIGSINIVQVQTDQSSTKVLVEINSNYTATANGKSTRYIITEKWLLQRKAGLLSPEPEKMHKLSCPACGAPANFTDSGYCEHCGTLIVPGQNQWFVKNRAVISSETIKTSSLLSYAPEVGTNYPTIYSQSIASEKSQFAATHGTTWEKYWPILYHNIASKYFMQIYENWANLKWKNVRHLLTDRLWESYNFWIEEYKRNNIRNALDDTEIIKIHVAKIETDKYYEAITLRIFASSKDYVVDKNGKILAGYSKSPRIFSEYWTFIRKNGIENDDYDMKSCPNCGAPLDKIGQNGICEYCGAKITTGNFSWVVAIITQDEEYKG